MRSAVRGNYQTAYVDGNTVRYGQTVPDYRQERREKIRRELEQKRIEDEKRRRREAAARRNQQRALGLTKGYVTFLTIAAMIIAGTAFAYIQLQSSITTKLKTISSLETQLENVTSDNEATQKRINTAVDLRHIKDVAMNELGMVYASEDQIVYYSVDHESYMNQYEDVPDGE